MKNRANENGAVLIVSLMLILLITILSASLGTMAFSSIYQLNKSEDNIELTSLAEMGITFYEKKVLSEVLTKSNNGLSHEDIKRMLEENPLAEEVIIDDSHSYYVEVDVSKSTFSDKSIKLHIESTGKKDITNSVKTIVATINLENTKAGGGTTTGGEENELADIENEARPLFIPNESRSVKKSEIKNCEYIHDENKPILKFFGKGNSINSTSCEHLLNANVHYKNTDIDPFVTVHIFENALFDNGFTVEEGVSLTVEKNAEFLRKFIMNDKSLPVFINEDAFFYAKDVVIREEVNIGRHARFDTYHHNKELQLKIEKNASLNVGGNMYVNAESIEVKEGATWKVGGSARFDFDDDDLKVEDDANITIGGNTYFTNKIKLNEIKGSICINGFVQFHKDQERDNRITISNNDGNCPSPQPNGTIYVMGGEFDGSQQSSNEFLWEFNAANSDVSY
jgi:hypothetical protein